MNTKIILKKLIIIFAVISLLAPFECLAWEYNSDSDIISDEEIMSLIPPELMEYFNKGATDYEQIKDFDGSFFFDYILKGISGGLSYALNLFLILLGMIIVISLITSFSSSIGEKSHSVLTFASSLCTAAALFSAIYPKITEAVETIDSLSTLLTAISPVMSAIYLAEGKIAASISSSSSTLFIVSVISLLTHSILLPVLRVCFAFEIISTISAKEYLSSVSSMVKNTFIFMSGAIMTVLSAIFTYQTVISQSADNVALRAAKFAISGLPLIGGALAEASRTVIGAVSLMKGLTGALGIIVLLLTVLPPFIELFLCKTVICLSRILASSLNCSNTAQILKGGEDILSFSIAILIIFNISAIFVLSVFLMITG